MEAESEGTPEKVRLIMSRALQLSLTRKRDHGGQALLDTWPIAACRSDLALQGLLSGRCDGPDSWGLGRKPGELMARAADAETAPSGLTTPVNRPRGGYPGRGPRLACRPGPCDLVQLGFFYSDAVSEH